MSYNIAPGILLKFRKSMKNNNKTK